MKCKRLFAAILIPVMLLCMNAIPVSAAGSEPPYAPTKVAVQNSGTGFSVTWSKAAGAAKYRVYYKTKESGWYYKDAKTNDVNCDSNTERFQATNGLSDSSVQNRLYIQRKSSKTEGNHQRRKEDGAGILL